MLPFVAKTLIAAAATFLTTVRDCGDGQSVFTVDKVSLDPEVPVPGSDMTLYLDYTVPDGWLITGGQAEYSVTYNFIPFAPSYEPLCQDVPCPLGPGSYQNHSTSQWPSGISGLVVSTMKWVDPSNTLLLCVEISGQTAGYGLDQKALVPWVPNGVSAPHEAQNTTAHDE